jgi:hypothetical protein
MPLAKSICTTSSYPARSVLVSSVDNLVSPLDAGGWGTRGGGGTTNLLKGVLSMPVYDTDGFGELEDFGPEIAADEADEVETGPPEIWVVRRAKPVRLPVEDVPDPRGCLNVPGTPVPRVEEIVFPGLSLIGGPLLEDWAEGPENGRAGFAAEVGDGGDTATHSSTSTYQAGGSGGAGTGSK